MLRRSLAGERDAGFRRVCGRASTGLMLGSAGKADDPAQQRVVAAVRGRGILGGDQFVKPVGGERQCDLGDGDPHIH